MNINATIIGQSIAFLIFVWFCMKYVWPPIIKTLDERKKQIADGLAAASEGKEELARALEKSEIQLQEAREKAQSILDLANKRAYQVVEDAKIKAKKEIEKMKQTAHSEIDQEFNNAKEVLREQLASLMVTGASRIVNKNIDVAANEKLVNDLVSSL